jgi:hypothetical protein
MADYSAIAQQVATLLAKDELTFDEEDLYRAIRLKDIWIRGRWTGIGTYESLTGDQKFLYDMGVAYLVASAIYEWIVRGSSSSNVVAETGQVILEKQQKDLRIKYSDPSRALSSSSSTGASLSETYYTEGWKILRGVTSIGYTTPLDTEGVTHFIQPTSILSPQNVTDEVWTIYRGLQ